MGPVEFTKDHEAKLSKMCNSLFPEFGEVQYLKSYMANKSDRSGSPYLRWYDNSSGEMILIEIHWFEFCLTKLALEIFQKYEEQFNELYMGEYQDFIADIFLESCETFNPIDFLYKKFKQLKQTK